jgi:hypothetical protein
MEIKILCPCGAKFKFEVEPVNGQSPGPVRCPACGRDSTDATNTIIHEQLTASAAAPKPAIGAIRIPAGPAPIAPGAPIHVGPATAAAVGPRMTVTPAPESTKSLSVKPPGEASVHAAPPSNASGDAKAPGSPKMAFMAAPSAGSGTSLSVAGGKKEDKPSEAAAVVPEPARAHPAALKMVKPAVAPGTIRLKPGYIGAIIGGIVGMAIWYFTVISTGYEMRWLAILVGVCTGWGARLLGGGKHPKLATLSGFAAVTAILLGQFLAIQFIIAEGVDELVEQSYKERIALARDAAAAKTDKDIRAVMAKDDKAGFDEKSADAITDEDLAKYRSKEFVALQKFANGSPSRTQYEAQIRKEIEDNGDAKYHFRIITLLWIVAGVTAAWKIVKPPEAN